CSTWVTSFRTGHETRQGPRPSALACCRLTGILFPIGFAALVWAGSPDPLVIADHRSAERRLFVKHGLGGSSGSTVDVARRVRYPWTEQMSRKMSRNVEK